MTRVVVATLAVALASLSTRVHGMSRRPGSDVLPLYLSRVGCWLG